MAVVSDRGDVREMVVTGPWSAAAKASIENGEIDRLVLNHALGFDESSLEFLRDLPVRELVVIDPRQSNLEPIHSLAATLRTLRVSTDARAQLDLTRLPELRELAAAWPQVAETIHEATCLEVAFLRGYQQPDLTPLASLTSLNTLELKDRPKLKSLAGLSQFPELRRLGIYLARDLCDIEELDARSLLESLALEACPQVKRLDALVGCVGLRELSLSECGDLASLGPIRSLTRLEQVSMFGTTRIVDGDLSPLAALPRLRLLRMQSRRSYRPTVDEIQASLPRL